MVLQKANVTYLKQLQIPPSIVRDELKLHFYVYSVKCVLYKYNENVNTNELVRI